ncbi:MAG: hypothetical protein NTZ05_02010 [Chloroflexi bacterium]|nr:hypothetical protein [Chloroflexota bacterium]
MDLQAIPNRVLQAAICSVRSNGYDTNETSIRFLEGDETWLVSFVSLIASMLDGGAMVFIAKDTLTVEWQHIGA